MNKILVFFFLTTLVLLSCKTDVKEFQVENLQGSWSLIAAERDGEKTATLDNAFFEIQQELFKHNLNGDTIAIGYSLEERILTIQDETLKRLEVLKLNADTLEAISEIGGFDFKFLMQKNVSE